MKKEETLQPCDACGEGQLHPNTRSEKEEYKGIQGQVSFQYSVCDNCGSELLDAADLLNNKREWVRFKKRVDGIPLGVEIAAMRKKHNLTQTFAAKIFGGGPVSFSKYENDDLIPDESMVSLLTLAIAYPDTIKRLAQVKNVALLSNEGLIVRTNYSVAMSSRAEELFSIAALPERRAQKRHKQSTRVVMKPQKVTPFRTLSESSSELVKYVSNGGKTWVVQ